MSSWSSLSCISWPKELHLELILVTFLFEKILSEWLLGIDNSYHPLWKSLIPWASYPLSHLILTITLGVVIIVPFLQIRGWDTQKLSSLFKTIQLKGTDSLQQVLENPVSPPKFVTCWILTRKCIFSNSLNYSLTCSLFCYTGLFYCKFIIQLFIDWLIHSTNIYGVPKMFQVCRL